MRSGSTDDIGVSGHTGAGCMVECRWHSPDGKPEEVVQLRRTCHTWAFQGMEGSRS